MIPLAIETLGTAGGELQELGKALKHSFETTVLLADDCSASADFHNTHTHTHIYIYIYMVVQTVDYNVVQANRAPLSVIRVVKDGQVVEALARDCRQ
jgi:hypothetical protein